MSHNNSSIKSCLDSVKLRAITLKVVKTKFLPSEFNIKYEFCLEDITELSFYDFISRILTIMTHKYNSGFSSRSIVNPGTYALDVLDHWFLAINKEEAYTKQQITLLRDVCRESIVANGCRLFTTKAILREINMKYMYLLPDSPLTAAGAALFDVEFKQWWEIPMEPLELA